MKDDPGPRGIAAFLPPALLNRLGGRLDELARLRHLWARHVPSALASHTHPLHYEAGCLYVRADSAAWATRLRHQQVELIRRLATERELGGLTGLRVRVTPAESAPVSPATPARKAPSRLPGEASALLRDVAADVSDPALRAALLRLAGRRRLTGGSG
jgi:hypothetical protein